MLFLVLLFVPVSGNRIQSSDSGWKSLSASQIKFSLKTHQPDSFLFGYYDLKGRYLAVGLEDGLLQYRLHHSGKNLSFHGDVSVNDGKWHNVSILYSPSHPFLVIGKKFYFNEQTSDNKWLDNLVKGKMIIGTDVTPLFRNMFRGFFFGCVKVTTVARVGQVSNEECVCSLGYATNKCELRTNECWKEPCKNGADCQSGYKRYSCNCLPGWRGKDCSIESEIGPEKCNESPSNCQNGGTCKVLNDQPTCLCTSGYTGEFCQDDTMLYERSTWCEHGTRREDDAKCICDSGFIGDNCDTDFNECEVLKPCKNNATCTDSHTDRSSVFRPGYTCSCTPGFKGENCSRASNPCGQNGKHCPRFAKEEGSEMIIFPVVGVLVLVGIVVVVVFVIKYCRNKSGMEGTYNPNRQEQIAGTSEVTTPKPPNKERVI